MHVSMNLVSYRLLFLLLVFTPFLFQFSSATQKITYACLKRGQNPYIVIFAVIKNEVVHDIFGKGAKESCGLMAKNVTGKGDEKWPYRLLVNLTGVGDVNHGICGVMKNSNWVELSIITRTSQGNFAAATDKEAKIKCDFSKDHFINTKVKVNLVEQKAIEENINITLDFEGSPTELTVGTETYLKMKLWSLTRFSMIVPFRCWAMRNATDMNKVLLIDDYCPVIGAPIKLMFQFYKSYSTLRSNHFFAFRFFDSDILLIRCLVDICLTSSTCTIIHCEKKGKRSISVQRHRRSAIADTRITVKNKIFSKHSTISAQLPFLVTIIHLSVLLLILIILVISLAFKLNWRKTSRQIDES